MRDDPEATQQRQCSEHLGSFNLHFLYILSLAKLLKLRTYFIWHINPLFHSFSACPSTEAPTSPVLSHHQGVGPRPSRLRPTPCLPYQQENTWLPRKVLVSKGRSAFLTRHFKACKKHRCNSSSICSAGKDENHTLPGGIGCPCSPPSSPHHPSPRKEPIPRSQRPQTLWSTEPLKKVDLRGGDKNKVPPSQEPMLR